MHDTQDKANKTTLHDSSAKKNGSVVWLFLVGSPVLSAAALILAVMFTNISGAQKLYEFGEYDRAKYIYEMYSLEERSAACDYAAAEQLLEKGEYLDAYNRFLSIEGYENSAERADEAMYAHAQSLMEWGAYDTAIYMFTELINYRDSVELIDDCNVAKGVRLYRSGDYSKAKNILANYIADNKTAEIYFNLCVFHELKANDESVIGDQIKLLLNYFLENNDNEDVAEVLCDSYFFTARFINVEWSGDDCAFCFMTAEDTLNYNFPWTVPELLHEGMTMIAYPFSDSNSVACYLEDYYWFEIIGFDSYDKFHPETVYIISNIGKVYAMDQQYSLDD